VGGLHCTLPACALSPFAAFVADLAIEDGASRGRSPTRTLPVASMRAYNG
jgi:hypothetical protein